MQLTGITIDNDYYLDNLFNDESSYVVYFEGFRDEADPPSEVRTLFLALSARDDLISIRFLLLIFKHWSYK